VNERKNGSGLSKDERRVWERTVRDLRRMRHRPGRVLDWLIYEVRTPWLATWTGAAWVYRWLAAGVWPHAPALLWGMTGGAFLLTVLLVANYLAHNRRPR
jgi:hypothetical protein